MSQENVEITRQLYSLGADAAGIVGGDYDDIFFDYFDPDVKVVRRAIAYEYYGVGDRDEAEAIFDPQVVMNPIDDEASSGLDAMRADMERWASAFDELKVTVEEIIDAGDQVVVVAHHQGRG